MPDRFIRPAVSTFAPRCLASIIVETECKNRLITDGTYLHEPVRFHLATSHRPLKEWMSPLYRSFDTGEAMLEWMECERTGRHRTYVFTPGVMDTLTLASFWKRIQSAGCKMTAGMSLDMPAADMAPPEPINPPAVPRDDNGALPAQADHYHFTRMTCGVNTQIVRYRRFDRSYQWCSNVQYCQSSEEELAESIEYKWSLSIDTVPGLPNTIRTPYERAMMWLRFYQYLSDWWIANDGGPWGSTVASCSYSYLRRRIPKNTIVHHDDASAGKLEEKAIFAGRRTCWYYGNIGTPDAWRKYHRHAPKRSEFGTLDTRIAHHDIRSMYPFLLSTQPFPVRLLDKLIGPDVSTVKEALEDYGVIATVTLRTERAEYPYRHAKGIIYPVGTFQTTLCGAELIRALEAGEVLHVKYACLYELDYPFRDACERLLADRIEARNGKRKAWELFIKMLSNSMSGRIALVPKGWESRPDKVPPREWGYYTEGGEIGTEIHQYRAIAGMVMESVKLTECNRPMGAAYAYLCSYGRWLMSVVRGMCPVGSVIAQDTDGIWCTDAASQHLYGDRLRTPNAAGDLNMTASSQAARFYGSQYYWYGPAWVMSGQDVLLHRPRTDTILARTQPMVIATSRSTPAAVRVERIVSRDVSRVACVGFIGNDGWMIPERLWMPDSVTAEYPQQD